MWSPRCGVKKCCKRSQHSPVTDTLDGGAPLQHVQAVGGWTTAKMITEIYDRNTYGEPVARYRKKPLPRREVNGDIAVR